MKEIRLIGGETALVDDTDFEAVSKFRWYVSHVEGSVYARRVVKNRMQRMHRFILGITDPKIKIDHRDHYGLNNQRYNLRIANDAQNQANRRKRKAGTSIYKGVGYRKDTGKFRAQIKVQRRVIRLGCFESESDAALAYNGAANKAFRGICQPEYCR